MPCKLHLGCGYIIKDGWINHDLVELPGVDIVHDLKIFPWPFEDNQFDEVFMKDVLEHLPDTIKTFEELYRITKPGAKVFIAVPYWNSVIAYGDPTHIKSFNEFSFNFFDPTKDAFKERPYYSNARFYIKKMGLCVTPFEAVLPRKYTRDFLFFNPILKKIILIFASFLNNIVSGLEIHFERTEN
jgi:SAM-dependent methyltransferase